MATPPDFTAGQVLTAAQMNKVGMWIVASATVGTAVSEVTISDCFSADYDDYRVVWSGGVSSTATDIQIRVGGIATGDYSYAQHTTSYAASTVSNAQAVGETRVRQIGRADTTWGYADVTVKAPYLTTYTFFSAPYHTTSFAGTVGGVLLLTTSTTSVTLRTNSGTITGGTITVYGINKG